MGFERAYDVPCILLGVQTVKVQAKNGTFVLVLFSTYLFIAKFRFSQ